MKPLNYHLVKKVIQIGVIMRSTITARGQTVIPAGIRKYFNLTEADRLEWFVDNNILKVVPVHGNPIDAFRGNGKGGSVKRLLEDREKNVIVFRAL
jgi:AbrB family looped-hinge helix DNA binding protein